MTTPDPRVIAYLDQLGHPYEVMPCDPELADTAAFCAAYGIPPGQSANAILVAARRPVGPAALCLVLATHRLDVNGAVRARMGVKKVSFAPAEETMERTGMEIGGVTPFGLPDDLPVWIDQAVTEPEWVVVGAGSRSAKIKVDPAIFRLMPNVDIIDDLAFPFPAEKEAVPDQANGEEAEPLDGV